MAKENYIDLPSNLSGLAYTDYFPKDEDGEVNVVYEADRCFTAWIEYTTEDGGVVRKIPILPASKVSPHASIPAKSQWRIVAGVGRGGFFRARLIE